MKKITATFKQGDVTVATAVGSFAFLPGSGTVAWRGPLVVKKNKAVFFDKAYAESFQNWIQATALVLGAEVEVQEEGEWEVFLYPRAPELADILGNLR